MDISTDACIALASFVTVVCDGLTHYQCKFVADYLLGLFRGRSVVLAQIARALERPEKLRYSLKRLSRNLGSKFFNDQLVLANYLEWVKPKLNSLPGQTYIAVDGTDVTKPYATKMPMMGHVWNGSHGVPATGYPFYAACAVGEGGSLLPVVLHSYSSSKHAYTDQKRELQTALLSAKRACPKGAVYLFDRGHDSLGDHELFQRLDIQFIGRVVCNAGGRRRRFWRSENVETVDEVWDSAAETEMPTITRARGSQRKPRHWLVRHASGFGLPARNSSGASIAPRQFGGYSLVFARPAAAPHRDGFVLFTNEPVRTTVDALEVLGAYNRRFQIEELFRLMKTVFDFEDMRALSWRGIQRTALLSHIAVGFLTSLSLTRPKLAGALSVAAPAIDDVPRFPYYRIADGLRAVLTPQGLREAA